MFIASKKSRGVEMKSSLANSRHHLSAVAGSSASSAKSTAKSVTDSSSAHLSAGVCQPPDASSANETMEAEHIEAGNESPPVTMDTDNRPPSVEVNTDNLSADMDVNDVDTGELPPSLNSVDDQLSKESDRQTPSAVESESKFDLLVHIHC